MWQPNKLHIKNLMTHHDTQFNFKRNKSIMIFSKNKTDSGADSNGGGKSTLLEGITLAITGETNRGVNKDGFITDGFDDCFIELNLSNNVGDVESLSIKRWFFRNKSSKIELFENGKKNKQITSVNEANKRIYELIGLSKDDLLHFFLVGQETSYSFLTANDNDKKSIISRFSDISFIDEKINELKSKRKLEEENLDSVLSKIQKCENKIEFIKEQIEELKENFEKNKNSEIKKLKEKIKNIKSEIEQTSKKYTDLDDKKNKSNKDLKKLKLIDINQLKSNIQTIEQSIDDLKKSNRKINHKISDFENILKGKLSCPDCKFEFNPNSDLKISDVPKLILNDKKSIEQNNKQLEKLEDELEKLEDELEKSKENNEKISDINDEIKSIDKRLVFIEKEILDKQSSSKKIRKQIKVIEDKIIDDDIQKFEKEIKIQKDNKVEFEEQKKKIDNEILDYDFWIHHFGKKGFLTFLTNKSIKSIEGVTNSYLKKMNSDLQIIIDGYTLLKSGDVREKINISILRNGVEISDFNRFSGGEKGRVKLANILGLQHLINLNAKNGGLNFLGLDEVFEGLDKTGQQDVIKILENLKVTSLVITHRNTPIGAENELFVEKINGVSKIIKQ